MNVAGTAAARALLRWGGTLTRELSLGCESYWTGVFSSKPTGAQWYAASFARLLPPSDSGTQPQHVVPNSHPEYPGPQLPDDNDQGAGYNSAPSTQQGGSTTSNRKRKPGDRAASSNTYNLCIDNAGSPSPSQCSRPQKRVRVSRQSEPSNTDPGEGAEDQISGARWTETELKKFVHALMGPDGYWDKFKKNSGSVFKKVGVLVDSAAPTPSNFMSRLLRGNSRVASIRRH